MTGIKRLLDSTRIYSGRIIDVTVDQVELENGFPTVREVVTHPGGAVALAWTAEGKLLFVRQPRYPVGRLFLELPAGKLEKGEDPLTTIQRELEEETGYRAERWSHLLSFYTSPGFCTELLHLFLAEGLQPGSLKPERDEMISVEHHSLDEAMEMIGRGEIMDAKTIIGVFWAGRFLRYAFSGDSKSEIKKGE